MIYYESNRNNLGNRKSKSKNIVGCNKGEEEVSALSQGYRLGFVVLLLLCFFLFVSFLSVRLLLPLCNF